MAGLNPFPVRLLFFLLCLPVLATDPALRAQLHAGLCNGAKVIPYSSTKFDTSDALALLDAVASETNFVRLS